MAFFLNPYSLTLILSGLVVGGISSYICLKFDGAIRYLGLTMLFASIWGFFYGFELTGRTLDELLFWVKLEYLGLLLTPVFWVIFALKYTGVESNRLKWAVPALFFIPILTYLLLLTNSIHHLHYKRNWVITTGPFPILGIENGPWYVVQTLFAYLCFFSGTLILWKRFKHANKHFKGLTRILIVGGFFPLVINVLYQTHIFKPFEGLDLTPFSFLFTYFFLAIAIVKFQLLDLRPVARDKILEMVTNGVIVFDQNMKVIDFNPAAKTLFKKPENLKIGQPAERLFGDKKEILQLLHAETAQRIDFKYQVKENISLYYKIEMVPLLDKKMLVSGHLLNFEDVTNEVLTNEKLQKQALELQQLNDLKDKFFSIISHDLKGPVFGVKELIHLTQSGLISPEEFLEILPEVSKNMEQVAILLENLLAWTSSQLRGEHIEKKDLELTTIIRSQKNLLDRIAKEKKIQIEFENLSETWVQADKNMIELILRNLMSNAIKFSPPESKIIVKLTEQDHSVRVCIQDFGVGIPEENLKKLNSGESFTTRGQSNESGTGLGLVLVREYISKNGGVLEVYSEEGKGSKFCFTLPSVQSKENSKLTQAQEKL